jgi:phage tail-like protein
MSFDLELPGAVVDTITEDSAATARPTLINRDPEPSETGVPQSASISFDLTDIGVDGISLAATQVYINAVLAFNAGTFLSGFNGPGSAYSNPQADTLRVTIDPTSSFAAEQLVAVRVVSNTVGNANPFDQTYSFTIEDTSAPLIALVQGVGLRRVRVTFDDPMVMGEVLQISGAYQTYDALRAENYSLLRQETPAVNVTVERVERVDDFTVDLVANIDLSVATLYRLFVSNVKNVTGYAILALSPYDFTSYNSVQPAARSWDLYNMLPAINRRDDASGDLRKFMACLQDTTDVILASIDDFLDIQDPLRADEQYVDALLQHLGDPFTPRINVSLEDKRRLIGLLTAIYKQKGTEAGILNAIRVLVGVDCTITPYDGTTMFLGIDSLNNTFVLSASQRFIVRAFNVTSPVVLTGTQRKDIAYIVDLLRPANTHFVALIDPGLGELDHLLLGTSELGNVSGTYPLTGNGTWILH